MTALLLALILAGRLLTDCQEQTANPLDAPDAPDADAVNSKAADENASDTNAADSGRSHSVLSDRKPPELKSSARKAAGPNDPGLRSPRNRNAAPISAAEPAKRPRRKLQSDELQLLRHSSNAASHLRNESRAAFERGLLPLADYSDQLALALQLELAAADLRGSEAGRAEALASHAEQLQAAAGLLQQFNQPAARGWQADLAQADFLAAKAAVLATTNPQSPASRVQALQLVSDKAQTQYALRLSDFQNGLSTLSDLSRAASHMAGDVSDPETADAAIPGLIDYRTRIQQILINTENLARRGADGGRIDYVHQAQFELNRSSVLLAGLSKNEQTASTAFQTADHAARDLLVSQARLYDNGVVKLFDMARAWSQWQELHRQASHFNIEISDVSKTQLQSELQRLTERADQQTDVRGRIAADVTMVHSLNILTDLHQLAADLEASAPQSSR